MNYSDPFGLYPCPELCAAGPAALAGVGAAEELVPGIGQVVGTATIIAAGAWGIYEGAKTLGSYLETRREAGKNSGAAGTGQTAGGRATDQYGNVLGPSGRPAVHDVDFSTKKGAKDAARNAGKGAPVQHPSPTRGDPHFHPTGADGEKVPGSPHYNYPE